MAGQRPAEKKLVAQASEWRYHDGPDPPDRGWMTTAHDDSAWRNGRAPFGYGDISDFNRYRLTDTGVSPTAIPGMRGGTYIATGLEHDEIGAPDYTPENRVRMMAKRYRKLETISC